jgi:hypothetical protein
MVSCGFGFFSGRCKEVVAKMEEGTWVFGIWVERWGRGSDGRAKLGSFYAGAQGMRIRKL